MSRPAVLLDRDGTINVKRPEGCYVTSPSDLVLLPGAAHAVRRLNDAGLCTVLVTNQRWLSRSGPAGARAYRAVQRRLGRQLARAGASLDGTYTCPHALDSCTCRKPKPGLLVRAAADLDLDLSRSVIIGDSETDIAAGRAAGTRTVRLAGRPTSTMADDRVVDIAAAVDLVLADLLGRVAMESVS